MKELPSIYDRRAKATSKLESAENALLKTAAKLRAKQLKKAAKAAEKTGDAAPVPDSPPADAEGRPLTRTSIEDAENNASLAERLVPQNKRPTHRLPLSFMPFALPFVGEEVDSIEWARDEIVVMNELLAQGRAAIDSESTVKPPRLSDAGPSDAGSEPVADKESTQEYPPLNSAFITFNQQIAAHMAQNALNHHDPYRMTGRYAEVAPEDVIWGNLGMNAYEGKVRMLISYAATAGLIILWAFPGEPSSPFTLTPETNTNHLHSCFRRYHLQHPCTQREIHVARLAQ